MAAKATGSRRRGDARGRDPAMPTATGLASLLGGSSQSLRSVIELEVQIAGEYSNRGPHSAIRHADLRLVWWCNFPQQEAKWKVFWEKLATRAKTLPQPNFIGDAAALAGFLSDSETRRELQSRISRIGLPGVVTCVEIDMAFPPGRSVVDSAKLLLEQGRGKGSSSIQAEEGANSRSGGVFLELPTLMHGT